MANKMITRTIKVYTYVTGKLNLSTMSVEDMRNFSFPYKLGVRERTRLEKDNDTKILQEVTGEALYGMSLETFIAHAHVLTKDEEEGLVER